jgi:hypothetical protein
MTRQAIIALALTLSTQPTVAAEPVSWQGRAFTEVRSLSELPLRIRAGLNMEASSSEGVADIGKPFNSGHVIISDWPNRGLLGAGYSGDNWILAIAHQRNLGGTAVIAYVFQGDKLVRQERVGYSGGPGGFAEIVRTLSQPLRPIAQLGGVSIDDSQQRVESLLGRPTEVVAHEQTYIGDPASKPSDLRITKELRYPGLSIWLREAMGVMEIRSTAGTYCQIGKICIGATRETVEEELHQYGLEGFALSTNSYSLRHETHGCQADISFSAGTVSSIRVFCRSW